MRKQAERYQIALIIIGLLVTAFFAVFFYRELFPQYRAFQDTYVMLEEMRAQKSGEAPPPFKRGVKQILIENESGGPPVIDRCTSCHVALQIEAFSPTRIQKDINGNIVRDDKGIPVKEPNPDYIWEMEGIDTLKTIELEGHIFDMTKALAQHPLMGRETRPFEYHPIDEYGCTSCHSGNGRSLTFSRAHGPVFDGQYEEADEGPEPVFLESNPEKDPPFSKIFNGKPSDKLLFQTTPILVGPLIQSKCVQCHNLSEDVMQGSLKQLSVLKERKERLQEIQEEAFLNEGKALKNLLALKRTEAIEGEIKRLAGSLETAEKLNLAFTGKPLDADEVLSLVPEGRGSLFEKARALQEDSDAPITFAEVNRDLTTEIDTLLENFKHGRFLYFNQACYACHRIAGMSRGGVGPELTEANDFYPWELKEAIVWPQGDLKTSTMPNFHLDHEEIQDLVTFLMAQTGRTSGISETDHATFISRWEGGEKVPLERPINPARLEDLRYAMTVFATEGCAACHRLKGFESDVGYKVELENPSFETLYAERKWFRDLFPEEALGSRIIEAIDQNRDEIDQRIVDNVREGSILEELESQHPGILESFYQNFKFAERDKEDKRWKEIVDKVLMVYIQEYGLGRLIGPRPNWSGIYRSDEWLIEHFRKPTRHIARSIMPVMPFDDTKFYALTFMLNELAKKNRDEVRQIWDTFGFDPKLAYELFCSQCHGDHLHGNGPVSQWIYPIPKNLRNAYFLKNFTRENMEYSLIHGVKGTPMPPWGEIGDDKPEIKTPVMTEEEAALLTDWIYSAQLKGAEPAAVPKWEYQVEDVLKELRREGSVLLPGELPEFFELRESSPKETEIPKPVTEKRQPLNPSDLFTIEKNPIEGAPEENIYHIKKEYYTEKNLQAGQKFFETNCSVCHGIEADGQGYRAGSMYDAKPRMLTNLHWVDQRDDLRLIRSIKYGVPGTSMTPWGDQTSSLQRLQLVMYIRALSLEQKQRDELLNSLYSIYDKTDQLLTKARASEYQATDEIQKKLKVITNERQKLFAISSDEAVKTYQRELELSKSLKEHKLADQLLNKIRDEVQKENLLFQRLGVDLIRRTILTDLFEDYLQLIRLYPLHFSLDNGKLELESIDGKDKRARQLHEKIVASIQEEIEEREKERVVVLGRLPSNERTNLLAELQNEIDAFKKLKEEMAQGFKTADMLREKIQTLFNTYQTLEVS